MSRKEVQSATLLPSTMVAIDDFLYTNRQNPFYVSAAGSSEPPNVELCERLLPAFRKQYRVPEEKLEYYRLHVTADVEHSQWIGEIVAAFAWTRTSGDRCGIRCCEASRSTRCWWTAPLRP